MAIVDSAEDFRMGRVVSRLFEAWRANVVMFLALAALFTIPSMLLGLYVTADIARMGMTPAGSIMPGGLGRFFEIGTLAQLIDLGFFFLLQAVLTQGTITWLNGEKPNFGHSLSTAVRNFLPLVAITVLAGAGVALGFVLLVVPAILLVLMWAVVAPVRVIEGTSITQSFGRSRALTKGHRGRIFLLFLAYFVVSTALGFAVRPLLGLGLIPRASEFSALGPVTVLVNSALRAVETSIFAVGVASIYYELRLVKEGIGAHQMAEAFD